MKIIKVFLKLILILFFIAIAIVFFSDSDDSGKIYDEHSLTLKSINPSKTEEIIEIKGLKADMNKDEAISLVWNIQPDNAACVEFSSPENHQSDVFTTPIGPQLDSEYLNWGDEFFYCTTFSYFSGDFRKGNTKDFFLIAFAENKLNALKIQGLLTEEEGGCKKFPRKIDEALSNKFKTKLKIQKYVDKFKNATSFTFLYHIQDQNGAVLKVEGRGLGQDCHYGVSNILMFSKNFNKYVMEKNNKNVKNLNDAEKKLIESKSEDL